MILNYCLYNLSYSCTVELIFNLQTMIPCYSLPCTYTVFVEDVPTCVLRTVISKLLTRRHHLTINFLIFLFIFPLKRGKILQDSHFSAVNWSNMYPAVAWKCPQILVIKTQHNLWGGSRWPLSECGLPFPLPNLVRQLL